jgi:probable F420-dependent oxidoreductase
MTTDRHMTLGLNLPYAEGSLDGRTPRWADILAMARVAEGIGFDAVWLSDHVGFGDPEGAWSGAWEAWTLLSALAASTTMVQLGTYVLAVPLRNPALLAKMAETLDEVSGGRVILGLGAGWNEPEFRSYGLPFDDRFDRFEDSLRIIAAMLRTGRSTHPGKVVGTHAARLAPRGPRPDGLPIMVGAAGPRMLRLTAELADHWNGGLRTAGEAAELLNRLDAACHASGRDPATVTRSVEVLVRSIPAADGRPPEERELRGTVHELVASLGAYAALGLDHLQVQLRPNTIEGVRAFEPILEGFSGTRSVDRPAIKPDR